MPSLLRLTASPMLLLKPTVQPKDRSNWPVISDRVRRPTFPPKTTALPEKRSNGLAVSDRTRRPTFPLKPTAKPGNRSNRLAITDRTPRPTFPLKHQLIDDEVLQAIDNLPDEFREVLVLSDLGDLKYKEIAQVLDIPVGTAKSRLFRARRLLRNALREYAVGAGYGQQAGK